MLFRDGLTDFTDKDLLTVRYPPGSTGVSYIRLYTHTYPMYLECIVHVSCTYFDVSLRIHQDTSRYNKIHLYLTLAIKENVSYLGISYVDPSLRYIQDTYLGDRHVV
jgi:hypothetical protein